MAKKLAGKRFFEACGRRDYAMHKPRNANHYAWPKWAQSAYMRGRCYQAAQRWSKPNDRP